ncbi:MAG TPA: hypothetical protein VEV61_01510 [Streptosporangiaceae bacterium]|nr:hypothetical protein [Streptosporangiaceae bacterium]
MTGTDLLVLAPWTVFGAAVTIMGIRLLVVGHAGSRRSRQRKARTTKRDRDKDSPKKGTR